MSLAVATTNTRLRFSASQVRKAPKHPARRSAVRIARAETLLDLVDPQNARRQQIRRGEGLAQIALGFAHILIEQRGAVEAQRAAR